jgi:acyl dehydratase
VLQQGPPSRYNYSQRSGCGLTQMDDIYFEDVIPGAILHAGPYVIPEQELMTFAAAWDPMPMHIDKAHAAQHGGLTAPGIYLLAIKLRLVHMLPFQRTVIASAGYDEVRFHRPAHPGDALTLEITWTDKRRSRSKPDRGIVTGHYALINAASDVVLSNLDTILMRLRNPEA